MRKGIVVVKETTVSLDAPFLEADSQEELRRKIEPYINGGERTVEEVEFLSALQQIVTSIERGGLIEAIKRVRELSGTDLQSAKKIVDRMIVLESKLKEANKNLFGVGVR